MPPVAPASAGDRVLTHSPPSLPTVRPLPLPTLPHSSSNPTPPPSTTPAPLPLFSPRRSPRLLASAGALGSHSTLPPSHYFSSSPIGHTSYSSTSPPSTSTLPASLIGQPPADLSLPPASSFPISSSSPAIGPSRTLSGLSSSRFLFSSPRASSCLSSHFSESVSPLLGLAPAAFTSVWPSLPLHPQPTLVLIFHLAASSAGLSCIFALHFLPHPPFAPRTSLLLCHPLCWTSPPLSSTWTLGVSPSHLLPLCRGPLRLSGLREMETSW